MAMLTTEIMWKSLLFSQKKGEDGVKTNEVTMITVLNACSHLRMLKQGRWIYNFIIENGPWILKAVTVIVWCEISSSTSVQDMGFW